MRDRAPGRLVVACSVALLHAGAGWMLIRAASQSEAVLRPASVELFLVRSPPALPIPRIGPRAERGRPITAGADRAATPAASLPTPPATSPDFDAAAERASESYRLGLVAAAAQRGFGFPAFSALREASPSIFAEHPARTGRVDRTSEGELIVWLDEHCYASLGSDSLILKDVQAFHRMLPISCNLPAAGPARRDLFAQFKRPEPTAPLASVVDKNQGSSN